MIASALVSYRMNIFRPGCDAGKAKALSAAAGWLAARVAVFVMTQLWTSRFTYAGGDGQYAPTGQAKVLGFWSAKFHDPGAPAGTPLRLSENVPLEFTAACGATMFSVPLTFRKASTVYPAYAVPTWPLTVPR